MSGLCRSPDQIAGCSWPACLAHFADPRATGGDRRRQVPNLPTLPWTAPWPRMASLGFLGQTNPSDMAVQSAAWLSGFQPAKPDHVSVRRDFANVVCGKTGKLCRVGLGSGDWSGSVNRVFRVLLSWAESAVIGVPDCQCQARRRYRAMPQGACARAKIKEMRLVVAWRPMYPARNG